MKRRDFLKSTLLSSAALAIAPGALRATCAPSDLLFFSIQASGAWDPTYLCDPHADEFFTFYQNEHIATATTANGQISYAPFELNGDTPVYYQVDGQDFFQKHKNRLLIINGVDTGTVSHPVGARHVFSGSVREVRPNLGAMVAGFRGPSMPLAFVSNGGFDSSQGLVPVSRVNNPAFLHDLALPNRVVPANDASTQLFHDTAVESLLAEAQNQRDIALLERLRLPVQQRAIEQVQHARLSAENLSILAEEEALRRGNNSNPAIDALDTVLAAMRTGICAAAHVKNNNFDTHSEHDSMVLGTGHRPSLRRLLETLDYLIESFESDPILSARGALVLVGSDFARTRYNRATDDPENGKDHWPTTSMMVFALGSAADRVHGGRVLGRTRTRNAQNEPYPGVQAESWVLENDIMRLADAGETGAFALQPAHIMHALQHEMGICDPETLERFPLETGFEAPLPLLRMS